MKALSLWPEWALEVLCEEKTVEVRSWPTDYRGKLLICATKRRTPGTIPGHALAVVDLVDCVPFEEKHMEDALADEMPPEGSWAWIFGEAWAVRPFKVNGRQRLYEVDDELIEILPEDLSDAEAEEIYNPIFYMPFKEEDQE